MKIKEMRELSVEELHQQVQDANKTLFESRFKHSLHQLENTALLHQLKHQLAQLKTVLNEKAAGGQHA